MNTDTLSCLVEPVTFFEKEKFMIHFRNRVQSVDIDQIMYCKADGNYSFIFLRDGKRIMMSRTLKYIVQRLSSSHFIRIHATYLVNPDFILRLHKEKNYQVELVDHTRLVVSRANRQIFRERLGKI